MNLMGIGASPGIAVGQVYLYKPNVCIPQESSFRPEEVPFQMQRLNEALLTVGNQLATLTASLGDSPQGKIMAAHIQMLEDEEIIGTAKDLIAQEFKTPEWAVYAAFDEFIQLLEDTDDPVISARAADLKDIRERVLHTLRGGFASSLTSLPGPVVIVTHDLTPSDAVTMRKDNVLAIITETGSITSHTAIIANSMGLPAILGVKNCVSLLSDGETVAVDAIAGCVHQIAAAEELAEWEARCEAYANELESERLYIDAPGQLADGTKIEIGLNIGSTAENADYSNVDFVGLFRTEFLYMDSDHLPTEEEQYLAYKQILVRAKGKPVTLRTFDIGGDKNLSYFPLPKEENPFLGLRALRLCLAQPELLQTQLRAALRASVYGSLSIMFPMVGRITDFETAKEIFEQEKKQLVSNGVLVGSDIKLGVMIEIPTLALMAEQIAKVVDFASIGTNDLCQYLCAADRLNPAVSEYYEMFSPGLVALLKNVIRAFSQAKKPLSVCGEMAGNSLGCILLAGLGLRKFSVSESKIASVKAVLASCQPAHIQQTAMLCCAASSQKEVEEILENAFKTTKLVAN